jgi:6-phosphogluconolactonase
MIKKTLLDAVPIPPENLHPIPVDQEDPYSAARIYEDEMRSFFRAPPGATPRFDLVLLGIGEDGHTASLFPGSPLLDETTHLAVAVPESSGMCVRITLTLPVINNAREVIFLVAGKTKALIIKRVIEEEDGRLPASLVRPRKGRLSFHLDSDAASLLAAPVGL